MNSLGLVFFFLVTGSHLLDIPISVDTGIFELLAEAARAGAEGAEGDDGGFAEDADDGRRLVDHMLLKALNEDISKNSPVSPRGGDDPVVDAEQKFLNAAAKTEATPLLALAAARQRVLQVFRAAEARLKALNAPSWCFLNMRNCLHVEQAARPSLEALVAVFDGMRKHVRANNPVPLLWEATRTGPRLRMLAGNELAVRTAQAQGLTNMGGSERGGSRFVRFQLTQKQSVEAVGCAFAAAAAAARRPLVAPDAPDAPLSPLPAVGTPGSGASTPLVAPPSPAAGGTFKRISSGLRHSSSSTSLPRGLQNVTSDDALNADGEGLPSSRGGGGGGARALRASAAEDSSRGNSVKQQRRAGGKEMAKLRRSQHGFKGRSVVNTHEWGVQAAPEGEGGGEGSASGDEGGSASGGSRTPRGGADGAGVGGSRTPRGGADGAGVGGSRTPRGGASGGGSGEEDGGGGADQSAPPLRFAWLCATCEYPYNTGDNCDACRLSRNGAPFSQRLEDDGDADADRDGAPAVAAEPNAPAQGAEDNGAAVPPTPIPEPPAQACERLAAPLVRDDDGEEKGPARTACSCRRGWCIIS